jgi:hypothetical protein
MCAQVVTNQQQLKAALEDQDINFEAIQGQLVDLCRDVLTAASPQVPICQAYGLRLSLFMYQMIMMIMRT